MRVLLSNNISLLGCHRDLSGSSTSLPALIVTSLPSQASNPLIGALIFWAFAANPFWPLALGLVSLQKLRQTYLSGERNVALNELNRSYTMFFPNDLKIRKLSEHGWVRAIFG